MSEQIDRKCATCAFGKTRMHMSGLECRRMPPTAYTAIGLGGVAVQSSAFPVVVESCWCGEWKERA